MAFQKTNRLRLFAAFLLLTSSLFSQVNYNANTTVPNYSGAFRVGFNFGDDYAWGQISDEQLATLAKNVGCETARPFMPESFTAQWGYPVRFSAFNHYKNTLGMQDITCIVGFPSTAKRETQTYPCGANPSVQSELFANLYEPIWDNNNSTPINENNYYAAYIYNMVTTYKDFVKFWEIWNEVGYDYTGYYGWQKRGVAGNWWENNPNPCDYKLRAPVMHYIRTLRISYDVIKTLDPTAFVCVSSPGHMSFLDAVLRNTDNPTDGSVTPQYPNKGGAYFDALAHHAYPHFDGSVKRRDPTDQFWIDLRHSDGAASGIDYKKQLFEDVFSANGYNGSTYPRKKWLITEMYVPRLAFNPNQWGQTFDTGGDAFQRNFIPKAYIACLKSGIMNWNIWQLGERHHTPAREEFDVMGLYQFLANYAGATPNPAAYSLKTTSSQLFNKTFDSGRTMALNLPSGVDGAAFSDGSGGYTYVLWAKTTVDKSETATATYSFPNALGIGTLTKREWNFGQTNATSTVTAQNIALTGSPIFLSAASQIPVELMSFSGASAKGQNLLVWKTGSESHLSHFEIERSWDGKTYQNIGKVKAKGNTSTNSNYDFVDNQITEGVLFYRLRMIDSDGTARFSNIITLKIQSAFDLKISPNPFGDILTIQTEDFTPLSMELIDVSGKVVLTQTIFRRAELATNHLPKGVYFLRINGKMRKLVKI